MAFKSVYGRVGVYLLLTHLDFWSFRSSLCSIPNTQPAFDRLKKIYFLKRGRFYAPRKHRIIEFRHQLYVNDY